jgi:signal transduction histidine kinase
MKIWAAGLGRTRKSWWVADECGMYGAQLLRASSNNYTRAHLDLMQELIEQIRMVAHDVCLGDLTELGAMVTTADPVESLADVVDRIHAEGSQAVRVRLEGRERAIVVPLERIDREMATPFGQPIYLNRPIQFLVESIEYECTGFSHLLGINEACSRALARDDEHRNDLVMVHEANPDDDWAITVQTMQLVQSCVLERVLAENEKQRAEMIEANRAGAKLQSKLSVASKKATLKEHSTRTIERLGLVIKSIAEAMNESQGSGAEFAVGSIGHSVKQAQSLLASYREETSKTRIVESLQCATLWKEALMIEQDELESSDIQVVEEFEACPDIESDHQLILRPLISLITNAKQAIQSQGGENRVIRVTSKSVIQSGVEGVKLTISDTGIGICDENSEKIFEAGYSTTQKVGLGLHEAKMLIERLGGALWVESDGIGKGATFCVFLPLKHSDEDEIESRFSRAS